MKKKARYIAFDTETGGINPKVNPILTAYFCTLDENFNLLEELSLCIRPEAPYDQVQSEALEVNKITLESHLASPECVTREQATETLLSFLRKNNKLRPLGQNLDFDLNMIEEQLLGGKSWDNFFNYNKYDLKPITNFLKDAGILPSEIGTLESMAKHFDTQRRGFHNAKADVLTSIEVYVKLVEMMKSLSSKDSSPKFNLLELLER